MKLRDFCNVWYQKHIQGRDPTVAEWRQWIWLSTFYVCTRDLFPDKDIPEDAEIIRMNSSDYTYQLELYVNYPQVLVHRAPDKNEIINTLEDLIWLTYRISRKY